MRLKIYETREMMGKAASEHGDAYLYCDRDSSALLTEDMINSMK